MLGSSNLIAVDIGEYSVKSLSGKWQNAANFIAQSNEYLRRNTHTDISQDDALSNDIARALGVANVKNASAFTAIPISEAITRDLTIEAGQSERAIEAAIDVEMSDALPFPVDQVYYDYAQHGKDNRQYLVVASRKDVIDPITEKIARALPKKTSISVDVDAYALGRLLSQIFPDVKNGDKNILLIDIGHKKSRFYFYGDNTLIYQREQQVGGLTATENIAELYDLDTADADELKCRKSRIENFQDAVTVPFVQTFAEQMNLVLDFYEASGKSNKEISRIVFIGGGACLDGLMAEVSKYTEYPVSILDLSPVWRKEVTRNNDWLHFCARYALSVALLAEGA